MPAAPDRWAQDIFPIFAEPSATGLVKLPALLPGDYLIAALRPEDWANALGDQHRMRVEDIARAATKVTLVAGDNAVIELKPARPPDKR
jgi:hypothetical protein